MYFANRKRPRGVDATPPGFLPSRANFSKIFLICMFSGSMNPNVIMKKILSLLHDIENQGQTPFCMTFHISGCQHDPKLNLVTILKFSRSRISRMLKKMTLTVDLGTQSLAVYMMQTWSWCRFQHLQCRVSQKTKPKISHLTLMVDLENHGQTLFCMTFHISGCKHDTKLILVSILTFSRVRISKKLKTITWPWQLTLELKVIHIIRMTLLISGCMPVNDSILVSILTFSRSRISENSFSVTWPWWMTLISEAKPIFLNFFYCFRGRSS